jgi:hypothetical protein
VGNPISGLKTSCNDCQSVIASVLIRTIAIVRLGAPSHSGLSNARVDRARNTELKQR